MKTLTPPMISPDEALRLIFERAGVLGEEKVPLADAVDRVLAAEIRALDSLPPFDNSAMDGFALRSADIKDAAPGNPVELTVLETVRAGGSGRLEVKPGEAARIMTGAPLPRGADSVVMAEMTEPGAKGKVKLTQATRPGSHVRSRGEDVLEGSLLLDAGARLRPYDIALLAAQGVTEVPVIRRPRVAVLATGDELVDYREEPAAGRIRDSNGPALLAALSRWGAPAENLGIAPDEPAALRAALAAALSRADVLVVSGGVSAGDFDCTKSVFAALGIREVFWKVAIKPGKPLFFGVRRDPGEPPKLAFGLPGNPVAALVCLEEFVRPALEKLQGHAPKHASYHLTGTALNDYPKPADRRQYLFCSAKAGPGGYELNILRPQGSAMLGMASRANALAVGPEGVSRVVRGDALKFRWLK
ncbi:MAG: molybdopterin molybdotransferase MoeA [Elusimicrobia bacterium]|nr:molybdopterin molybdotransferase MoeA [Elusimicrobiota bacterium]